MKMIKLSALFLASGLFLASCGEGANEETSVDTMQMSGASMEESAPMPDTANGMNNTGNTGARDNSSSMSGTTTTSGDATNTNASGGDQNSTNESSTGKPTENPGKAPGNGHPANGPDKKNGSTPNL